MTEIDSELLSKIAQDTGLKPEEVIPDEVRDLEGLRAMRMRIS